MARHGRTYSEQRFSPLNKINTSNVKSLGVAWEYRTYSVRGLEATPIVVDGVMFITLSWSKVIALDAKTGKELWQYDPKVPGGTGRYACCDVVNRGVALWKGNGVRRHARRTANQARRQDGQSACGPSTRSRTTSTPIRSPARRARSNGLDHHRQWRRGVRFARLCQRVQCGYGQAGVALPRRARRSVQAAGERRAATRAEDVGYDGQVQVLGDRRRRRTVELTGL